MTDRIEGKVARILTNRRLIINKGSDDGVGLGMRFAILSPVGLDVRDPDTDEPLGSVDVARTVVKVIAVDERLCTARTFRTVRSTGIFGAFASGPTEREETLRTDESTVEREIGETESKIKIGDTAVEVVGDEFEGLVLGF